MKWDIHYEVHTAMLNKCINCTEEESQLSAFSIAPQLLASSTNSMIASLWICMSTVYKPCTVFLAYQYLLVQIHSHLPVNGKSDVDLFNGVSWNRGKWKAGSHWKLNPGPRARTANNLIPELQPPDDHQLLQVSIYLCRYGMLHSYTSDMWLYKPW